MKLTSLIFFVVAIIALLNDFAFAQNTAEVRETLSIKSDYWCPYVCDPNSDRPGYMVEVARHIFDKHNISADVSLTNWIRAIKDTRVNRAQGLIGSAKTDAPDFVFHNKALGVSRSAFFTRKDSTWVYKGRKSLQNMRIGIINGYSYGTSIDKMISARHKSFIPFSGDRPLDQVLKMIKSGRLDAFIENPIVLHSVVKERKMNVDSLKAAGWVKSDQPFLYLALSPANPNANQYAEMMDRGIEEMRRSGELQRILDKYGLEDWEKSKMSLGAVNNLSTGLLKSPLDLFNMFYTGSL
ncbi:substrate-binding periplasmic protein [Bdellovibrio reynosensis]|uniref:Transporter substrate-binding domain-containing protein n=1 Tax=Bdellovibrio reynosensis TaxID=2835041 RepID=A0ABY4CCW1_9BACT|nr:ABC transporter substrate-binding protein [Bdellovibrio reynosensis]UOF02787.1 transporter substrate-binding domain-containing protein [Bdellovibrio reynosensis]